MKTTEYIEGPEALQNFKRGMTALFKVPKEAVKDVFKKGVKATAPKKKRGKD